MTGIDSSLFKPSTPETTAPTQAASDEFRTSLSGLTENFDNFLSLLTIQLQNQDPTDPMDTDKMVQQLVDFTGVEQQIKSNKHLEEIANLTSAGSVSQAISYIGLAVEYEGDRFSVIEGQTASTISYDLSSAARTVEVRIFDDTGSEVRFTTGDTSAGQNHFNWDLTDNFGQPLPPGNYRAVIRGLDPNGEEISLVQRVNSVVDGVDNTGGETLLTIGNQTLRLSEISRVGL